MNFQYPSHYSRYIDLFHFFVSPHFTDLLSTSRSSYLFPFIHFRIRERNDHERTNVDDMFMRAANADKAVKAVEEKIAECHERRAKKMLEISEDAQQEYLDLRDEDAMLVKEIAIKQRQIAEFDARIGAAEVRERTVIPFSCPSSLPFPLICLTHVC